MAKRRSRAKQQGAEDATATTCKEAPKKSPEPKAKKSRLTKVVEVIQVESSPEKEPPKPVRSSKLSRNSNEDQKRKLERVQSPKVNVSNTPKAESITNNKSTDRKKAKTDSPSVKFNSHETVYHNDQDLSPIDNDLPLCSQSVEPHCDVIWQSNSPISFTQAAKVISKKSTNTADLIKKYSHNNAGRHVCGSPILPTSSTPPLLGLWSASSSNANAKRRMRGSKGRGMKRSSAAGQSTSSQDIFMKLSLVLESKSEEQDDDETEEDISNSPGADVDKFTNKTTGLQQPPSPYRNSSQTETSSSAKEESEQNRSLDLFESEGYLTQPLKSASQANGTSRDDDVKPQQKEVSQGFAMSSAGDTKDPNLKETVQKVFVKSSAGDTKVLSPKETVQKGFVKLSVGDTKVLSPTETVQLNQSCEDLWNDDDLDDDSFVMKATQELFDSEAFSTPKNSKNISKTSTPLSARKPGRLTFTLNSMKPIAAPGGNGTVATVAPSSVVKSSCATTASMAPLRSSNANKPNERSITTLTTAFKKPLPTDWISPPPSNVPFQSYHNSNTSKFTNITPQNIQGMTRLPPPRLSTSIATTELSRPAGTGRQSVTLQNSSQSRSEGTGAKCVTQQITSQGKPAGTGAKYVTPQMTSQSQLAAAAAKTISPLMTSQIKPAGTTLTTFQGKPARTVEKSVTPQITSQSTVMNQPNNLVSTEGLGKILGNPWKPNIITKTGSKPVCKTYSTSCASGFKQSCASASYVPAQKSVVSKKPETSLTLSVVSESDMMDSSFGDDLLLSLVEPDEQLDKPQIPNATESKQKPVQKKENPVAKKETPDAKIPTESAWDEDEDDELLMMTSQAMESSLSTAPKTSASSVSKPQTGISSTCVPVNKLSSTVVQTKYPAPVSKSSGTFIHTNTGVTSNSLQNESLSKPSATVSRPASKSLMQTSVGVTSKSLQDASILKPSPPLNKLNNGTLAHTKPSLGRTGTGRASFTLRPPSSLPSSSTTNQQNNSTLASSKSQTSTLMTFTSNRKPITSVGVVKPLQTIPLNNKQSSSTTKPSTVCVPLRSVHGPLPPTSDMSKSNSGPVKKSSEMLISSKPAIPIEDQAKKSEMDDNFLGDDELLCEDQVLAMLDNIESQQLSDMSHLAGPSHVLCSTQKPVPGPTQQPNDIHQPNAPCRSTSTMSSSKATGKFSYSMNSNKPAVNTGANHNSSKSKTPLASVTYNQNRLPSQGTPPVPDISPIKPCAWPQDDLLGSTINLALVDKHYPKCSPEEIERKKTEALKRRQKKKPGSSKVAPVV